MLDVSDKLTFLSENNLYESSKKIYPFGSIDKTRNPTYESSTYFHNTGGHKKAETGLFFIQRKLLPYEEETIENIASYKKKEREKIITCQMSDIYNIISHDEFIDGETSKSEAFIQDSYGEETFKFIVEALMRLYLSNLNNPHILEGILVMVSSIPYEDIEPEGQIMAMGLLSNTSLAVRDRAIQSFERWNSKKGLAALKSLDCHPKWLQKYVEKVITYIERDGTD